MADCIDPTVDNVQPAQRDPVIDPSPADARIQQLTPCNDAMLLLGQTHHALVHPCRSTFTPNIGVNMELLAHWAIVSDEGARVARDA